MLRRILTAGLAVVLSGTGAFASYSSAILADSPAAYWRLGTTDTGASGSVAHDQTGNFPTNFTYAAATSSTPGLVPHDSDTAKSFNNTSVINDTKGSPLIFTPGSSTNASVEALVNISSFADVNMIYSESIPGGPIFGLDVEGTTGLLRLFAFNTSASLFLALSTSPLQLNKTYDVVGTFSSATGAMIVYVNGVQAGTPVTFTGTPRTGITNIELGGYFVAAAQPHFNGVLDEVSVYNTVLTPTQILNHFDALPEPASLSLLGVGGLLLIRRFRKN